MSIAGEHTPERHLLVLLLHKQQATRLVAASQCQIMLERNWSRRQTLTTRCSQPLLQLVMLMMMMTTYKKHDHCLACQLFLPGNNSLARVSAASFCREPGSNHCWPAVHAVPPFADAAVTPFNLLWLASFQVAVAQAELPAHHSVLCCAANAS